MGAGRVDLDWDDPAALEHALGVVLGAVGRVEALVGEPAGPTEPAVVEGLARPARSVTRTPWSVPTGPRGSVGAWPQTGGSRSRTPKLRHGRKTTSVRVDGDKRHVLRDLDSDLVPAVG